MGHAGAEDAPFPVALSAPPAHMEGAPADRLPNRILGWGAAAAVLAGLLGWCLTKRAAPPLDLAPQGSPPHGAGHGPAPSPTVPAGGQGAPPGAEERLWLALDGSGIGIWDQDLATGALWASEPWSAMLGYAPGEIRQAGARERLVHPQDLAGLIRRRGETLEGRAPAYASEHRLRARDGRWVWVLERGRVAARDAAGRPVRLLGTQQDITARREAERARELVVNELGHRMKNTLATVQAMASHTLRATGGEPAGFARDFGARLQALARAHDLLVAGDLPGKGLEAVLHAALAPWLGDSRLSIRPAADLFAGGRVSTGLGGSGIGAGQVQALVLALHELATNASKYGALSWPEGRVELRWGLEPGGSAQIYWVERGGPLVAGAPARRGFGTRLLERGSAAALGPGAAVELHFEPAGVRATLRFRAQPEGGS